MTAFLPPNLLALFKPREPLPYLPPAGKLPHEKDLPPYSGISAFIKEFEDPKDVPPPVRVETKEEKLVKKKKMRDEQVAYKLEQDLAMWNPASDPNITSDPSKTMIVARISYETSDSKLKREFENYGRVKKVTQVMNSITGKPRGYAFITFESERDMRVACKRGDGKKIDGFRVVTERVFAQVEEGWKPRRLGGGLGSTRRGGEGMNSKYSDKVDPDDPRSMDAHTLGNLDRPRRASRSNSPDRRGGGAGGRRRSDSRERMRGNRELRRGSPERRRKEDDIGTPASESRNGTARKRRRSGSREHRRRSRSRERKRGRRSRSRERRGSRSRDHKREPDSASEPQADIVKQEPEDGFDHADQSNRGGRHENSDRRRSRSRDRKRGRRSRSRERRGGSRSKEAGPGEAAEQNGEENGVSIKQEVDNIHEYEGAQDSNQYYNPAEYTADDGNQYDDNY